MKILKFVVSVLICGSFLLLGCDNPFGSSKEESFSTNVTTTISRAQSVYVGTVIDGDTFWAHREIPQSLRAHSGRTDSNGGHWDRSNGTYHYHSGGSSGGGGSGVSQPVTVYVDDLPQGSFKVRLSRVRCPETATAGAPEAKARLEALISGKTVDLQKVGNSYDRVVCEVFCGTENVCDKMLSYGYTDQGN